MRAVRRSERKPIVIAARSVRFQEAVIAVLASFVFWGILAGVLGDSSLIALVGLLAPLATAFILWRALRIGAHLDDRGIEVRNLWRVHRMQWGEVDRIGPALIAIGPLPTSTIGLGNDRQRRWVRILGVAGSRSAQEELVEHLSKRDVLARARFDPELPGYPVPARERHAGRHT